MYHARDEHFLPTDAEQHLAHTTVGFFDDGCRPDLDEAYDGVRDWDSILALEHGPSCGSDAVARAAGTRSRGKHRTFFLRNVAPEARRGSCDAGAWTTYFHAYANDRGGVTLQYWRFYAFDGGSLLLPQWGGGVGGHGGDWEGVHVVLDARGNPIALRLLGHTTIERVPWSEVEHEGDRVVVYAEQGGHSSRRSGRRDGIRQETWTNGRVSGIAAACRDARFASSGALVDLGEKTRPLHAFIRYSGLWGSVRTFGFTSGYWGPAFNETEIRPDGFVTAWCEGSRDPERAVDHVRECYPDSDQR